MYRWICDVVNEYLATHNIMNVRTLQNAIAAMYEADASQYLRRHGGVYATGAAGVLK